MATLTKEEWADVKRCLSSAWGSQYFDADGYLIHATVITHKMRLLIEVYVDGWLRGENCVLFKEGEESTLTPIAAKFYCYKQIPVDKRYIAHAEKYYGKREAKKQGVYKKSFYTSPYYRSASALITRFKKTCEHIELIDYDQYRSRLSAKEEADHA